MKALRNPRFWVGLASIALVITVGVVDGHGTSPGNLSAVHARVDKLTGFHSCAQCHGGWFESMTSACYACHEGIEQQIDSSDGFHGALGKAKAEHCAPCHTEHHGEAFVTVNRQSFAQAGIADQSEFDHRIVGYEMGGKHLEQECSKCHVNADAAVLPAGEFRFMGLRQDCASCHDDPHAGRMRLACASCHAQTSFQQLGSKDHDRFLPLTGGHREVGCRDCHAEGGTHSLESLGSGRDLEPRRCADCHESPHAEPFLADQSCGTCHESTHRAFAEATVTPERHRASGFPLDLPHDQVACEQCHDPKPGAFLARYPGRDADDCASCHEDPHAGQFGQTACLSCHDRQRFEPHRFTAKQHAGTELALTGKHLAIDCEACHKGEPRSFRGTVSQCAGCHADAHEGSFPKTSCNDCHVTTKFSDVTGFDHGRRTRFDLRGAHTQETCEACHPRSRKPDEFGRRFGRVEDHFGGGYESCATCHNDPHAGQFETGCATCHTQASFRVLSEKFDHGKWTGFPLDGAHGETSCSGCHIPLRRGTRNGRTMGQAKGARCADCHQDPHAGQFREKGLTRCDRCHKGTGSFSELAFRHDRDSRFKLGKAHEPLDCAACHKPFREVVRYRPLGRKCVDCHKAQKDPLRRRKWRK